ncbi:hypothetical protein E1N52_27110 [Paraburkholderia guartelaensis]|uniref:Uncharacterized protein n=1 Tax=Paraburkholderia guartelaensis TaxID=2546446 RepID=A0A4R5L999_9BURK|nr:hypothetical protein [Paraburkholderia guartelaensis]TDG05107.1 hypothetical protein E1N52_27110 [Paraburkholderia guartelaensis]
MIAEAAQRVRAANRRPSAGELETFEQLLEAVRLYGSPIGRQAEVLDMIASRNGELFSQFELPVADFEAVGRMEEEDWLFVQLQLALLRAAREVIESS